MSSPGGLSRAVALSLVGLLVVVGAVFASQPRNSASLWGSYWSLSAAPSGADVADCDVCSSEELRHLRALYNNYQASWSYAQAGAEEQSSVDSAHRTAQAEAELVAILSKTDAGAEAGGAMEKGQEGGEREGGRRGRALLAAEGDGGDLSAGDLRGLIEEKEEELEKARTALKDLKKGLSRQQMEVENLDKMLSMSKTDFKVSDLTDYRNKAGGKPGGKLSDKTKEFVEQCKTNLVTDLTSPENKEWAIYKGYACEATEDELKQYMNYELRGLCPDDWFFVQNLIFVKNCYALPKRRCLTRTPQQFIEPLPRAVALFNQRALHDGSVRWNFHSCDSYECLNKRTAGDCKSCFNMTLEANRWRVRYRGSLTIKEVVQMKGGSLRLGLDAGRGTGSFAAHMARYNVTVLTMAMDIEARKGTHKGLPYMETIAQRGLIPLHVPHTARLPFFDNTLDLVHCVNSVKYLPLGEFEDMLYEWDRVLRAGGIMWFELFYAPEDEMKVYVQIIELLKYRRLYWEITKKPLEETKGVPHVYLNAVIEKPARADESAAEATKGASDAS